MEMDMDMDVDTEMEISDTDDAARHPAHQATPMTEGVDEADEDQPDEEEEMDTFFNHVTENAVRSVFGLTEGLALTEEEEEEDEDEEKEEMEVEVDMSLLSIGSDSMDEEREGRGRPEQEQVGANPPTLLAEEMADDGDGDVDAATEEDVAAHELLPDPTLTNLREISSLASWTVSTYKPGCGVEALRSPSTSQFWQSDGPQPHLLNIHFNKLVKIVKLRVYLDFELDESYTPTRMHFFAGTGMHDLTEFAAWAGECPRGWVDVGLQGVGPLGSNVLRCFVVQIRVCENHQNGKDTHVRGVQLFARDETVAGGDDEDGGGGAGSSGGDLYGAGTGGWMRDRLAEPGIR